MNKQKPYPIVDYPRNLPFKVKRIISYLKWTLAIILLLIIIVTLLRLEIIGNPMMNMSFRSADKKVMASFETADIKPALKYHTFKDRSIRYLILVHDENLPFIVFIHGAPGSLSDYLSYFKNQKLISKANIISVDRLGYGYSGFGQSEISIKIQADAIHSIIEQECPSAPLIVGHSYGGPIAISMAMNKPDSYSGLILLAPALDPENEKEISLAKIPSIKPISWLVPPALRVAADEKLTHVEELEKLINSYDLIKIPVCHIHGTVDSLVPYENLPFLRKKLDASILEAITLENVDHFLPWSHHDLIVDKILQMTQQ